MKLTIIIILIILLSGCVATKSGDLWYFRLGPQKLDNLHISEPNGLTVQLGKQEADPTTLLLQLLKSGVLVVP